MRILFVVPYAPTRIRTRPLHLIGALRSAGHEVTVGTVWSDDEEREAIEHLKTQVSGIVAEQMPVSRSVWNCLRALPSGEPLQAHFSWSPSLAARLRQAVEETAFDAIHVEHLRGVRYGLMLKQAVAGRANRPSVVWDSVDCISLLFERTSQQSIAPRTRLAARLELPRTERYEGWAVNQFDRVVVTSDIDRRALTSLAKAPDTGAPIEVVPNGVDLEYFSPTREARQSRTVVITGKMSYHANATAATWFVRRVMPHVWSVIPDTRVWIVGKDPTSEILKLGRRCLDPGDERSAQGDGDHRVFITGTVPDVRPFLRRATVAAAPIQYGVGIQNKVLEAMACGTPVVATPDAAAGLRAAGDSEISVASSPAEFASAVRRLLENPQAGALQGRAGRTFIERHHDWRHAGQRLAEIYRDARP